MICYLSGFEEAAKINRGQTVLKSPKKANVYLSFKEVDAH
jgi:hypothetical protein